MAKVRTDRLLKLADFLETVPRKSFDLESWQTKQPTRPEGKKQGECGFAGCAVGWAVHAKLFRDLRFSDSFCDTPHLAYKGRRNWGAVEELFGMEDEDDIFELFSISNYSKPPTPKQVAARIRKFVKRSEART